MQNSRASSYILGPTTGIVRDVPDDKKKEIITKWLTGESREKIATSVGMTATVITSVINEWKRDLGAAIADAYRGADEQVIGHGANPVDVIRAFKLMLMLKKFGVEAESVDDFIARFAKVILSTGVTPEGLANIVKQVLKLADLDGVEIYQIPAQVEALMNQKRHLETEVEQLNQQKDAATAELGASTSSESPSSTSTSQPSSSSKITPSQSVSREGGSEEEGDEEYEKRTVLSEFGLLVKQLNEYGLSLSDVAAFSEMIRNSKKFGYDFASVLELVSSLKSLEQQKSSISSELNQLHESEKESLERQRSVSEKLATVQPIIDSVEKLKELGFDLQDFELIYDRIGKLVEDEGLDHISAKSKFFNDVKGLYETGVRHEEVHQSISAEGSGSETEPGNSKELVALLERLRSNGVTEQTLIKSVIINDLFKVDLDSLADDLKKYKTVREAARKTIELRNRLESEELEVKHKLIALEEQRQRLISSMDNLIDKSKIEVKKSAAPSTEVSNEVLLRELEPLARKIRGEIVNLDELKVSLNLVIDAISNALDPRSLTRKILDHAKLALEHEKAIPRNSG